MTNGSRRCELSRRIHNYCTATVRQMCVRSRPRVRYIERESITQVHIHPRAWTTVRARVTFASHKKTDRNTASCWRILCRGTPSVVIPGTQRSANSPYPSQLIFLVHDELKKYSIIKLKNPLRLCKNFIAQFYIVLFFFTIKHMSPRERLYFIARTISANDKSKLHRNRLNIFRRKKICISIPVGN